MIIPFMKVKWVMLTLSVLVMVHLFFYTFEDHEGFKQGLDFSGGLKLELAENKVINVDSIRKFFEQKKMNANVLQTGQADNKIVKIELDAKIDTEFEKEAELKSKEMGQFGLSVDSVNYMKFLLIQHFSRQNIHKVNILNADKVGPTVGGTLRKSSLKLLLITLFLISFYVTFRFHFTFAMGAAAALIHDLLITLGLIGYFQIPLSVPVMAALLTILGYSINDTIVIFDRIRENLGHDSIGFERVIDKSITESLTRTIITSVTTLLSVFSVYLYGGEGLKDMALVLIFGIIVGTYSSSFIASPMVILLNKFFESDNT